jgi:hypothetical protein
MVDSSAGALVTDLFGLNDFLDVAGRSDCGYEKDTQRNHDVSFS